MKPDDMRTPHLDAIQASPDDDALRLVFADWLEESVRRHGAVAGWSELIQVQCRLAAGSLASRARLLRREHELLTERDRWWPFDGAGFRVETFSRGFPATITAESVAAVRTLSTRMPWLPMLDDIRIDVRENDLLALAGLPALPTRGLTLSARLDPPPGFRFDQLDARLLVRWLRDRGISLERLGINGQIEGRALRLLLEADELARSVHDLSIAPLDVIDWDGGWRDPAIAALARFRLRRFDAGPLRDAIPAQTGLEALSVESVEGVRVARLPHLRELTIGGQALRDGTVRGIVSEAPRLRRLGLGKHSLGPHAIESFPRDLERVELWSTAIGDAGVELLATRFPALTHLDVTAAGLTAHGARALAASTTLPDELRLAVSRAEAGDALDDLRERFAVVIAR